MIRCIWKDGTFKPYDSRAARDAFATYEDGQIVVLDVVKGRSRTSHDHYFAVIAEAHGTLPEHLAERFPTDDSLRHFALCQTGYCDVKHYACNSNAEALRWLPRVQAMSPDGSQLAISGSAIVVKEPRSQSMKAMGGKVFQESKTAVLEVIAGLLETTPDRLAVAA